MNALVEVLAWLIDPANWTGPEGIVLRIAEHLVLTVVSMVAAGAIAVPLALWLGHVGRGGALAINISNVGRAIPTFAVLILLAIGPLGIGVTSTVVALVLFAIPPLLTNAYVGMREVDRDLIEAARGMGMTGPQILRQVELPVALPLIMTGIRLATVQVIATATLAAVVGGGGLGRIITAGFARQDQAMVVGGAVIVALLAIAAEIALGSAQKRIKLFRIATRVG
ncbi:MAG: ABC transporter permease subunit [Streptosporangiales bacterium]|nr:ABC transporter permease subunit [Streptosporangiales bacterium]